MDSTISSGFTCIGPIKGCTIPAAVRPATVAEPNAILISVAISHPSKSGDIVEFLKKPNMQTPVPLTINIC